MVSSRLSKELCPIVSLARFFINGGMHHLIGIVPVEGYEAELLACTGSSGRAWKVEAHPCHRHFAAERKNHVSVKRNCRWAYLPGNSWPYPTGLYFQ